MYLSRGAMAVDRVLLSFVFSVTLCNAFTHTTAHCSPTEAFGTRGAEELIVVSPRTPIISNVDDTVMDVVGLSGELKRDTTTSPDTLYAAALAFSNQKVRQHAIPSRGRSAYLSTTDALVEQVVQQAVQSGGVLARESPRDLSGNIDRRLLNGTQESAKPEKQGSCPHQLPEHLFPAQPQNRVSQVRETPTERKRSASHVPENNIIIKWYMSCLGDLPRKLEDIHHALEDVEKDELEVHLFNEREDAGASRSSSGGSQKTTQDPLVFRRGCFTVTGSTCRKELEQLFKSRNVETLQATFYPTFGVDVLTFTNLTAVMQAVGVQDASTLLEYMRASKSPVDTREESKLTEVGQCIESLSFDRAGRLQGKTARSVLDNPLNDIEYTKQWHHMSRLSNYSLWSDVAWEDIPISPGDAEGDATVVGLIDSGCYVHEDYWASDADNRLWRNPGETDCNDNIDNDGNGYVDDCWGWDFITNTNNVFSDYTGHGTSLASLLVGKHNDGRGGAGVMKFGKVMCIRAATQGVIYLSTLVGAFDYALRNGARVSVHAYAFAKAESDLKALFESAYEQDHLAVVSAGSQMCDLDADAECMVYPAGYGAPSTLVVGSSNLSGGACCGTNWGKKAVNVFAAGSRIYAGSCINHKDQEKLNCSNCYAFVYGSSISAGLTAGVAALVWAYMRKVKPAGWSTSTDKESTRIKKALIYSSMPSARIAGACEANGVINMHRALHYYDTVPAGQFVPKYKDSPTLFRWNFPPFFQDAGEDAVNLISSIAA